MMDVILVIQVHGVDEGELEKIQAGMSILITGEPDNYREGSCYVDALVLNKVELS